MKKKLLVLVCFLAFGLGCQNNDSAPEAREPEPRENAAQHPERGRGMMDDGMMGEMMRDMPEWMMSGDMRMNRDMMRDMRVIRDLLANHGKIQREVEDVPGGVRTLTTSSDPDVARSIRTHVRQMKKRVEEGRAIRHMDPVFREIFKNHSKIEMEIEDVPDGVRVMETSSDPQVTLLIRQHARRAVSEFVQEGMPRAMQPTPLPEGYHHDP